MLKSRRGEVPLVGPMPKLGPEQIQLQKYGRRMFQQDFSYPDGETADFWLFGANTVPVFIFAVTKSGEVVVTWQYRHAVDAWILELPGGNPKAGQTHEDVIRVELVEETGYWPGDIHVFRDRKVFVDPASFRMEGLVAVARGCEFVQEPKPDRTELILPVLYDLPDWVAMCDEGQVQDSKSVQATRWAVNFLGR